MEDVKHTLGRGFLGVISTGAGIAGSLADVETALRITSLVAGIAVTVLTGISIWRRMRK